jgi:fructokinase
MKRIGVDVGGTKIEIIAFGDSGEELLRRRVSTPAGNYRRILHAIAELVHGAEEELREEATIGIGTPGAISRGTGLLKNSNSTCLNGQPMLKDLTDLLGRPVRMTNDANCFALSEAASGAARGREVVFGVIVGTGTGAGIVVRGNILTGINGIAGEWGHNPLPWPGDGELPGPDCYCGKAGCIETFLSGPGMTREHRELTGEAVDPPDIVRRALEGDRASERTLRLYEDRMARSLAHVINILDPDVIVLGGGMSNIRRLYENVPRLWTKYVFSDRVDTMLTAPEYGDSSGVRGAALLWGSGEELTHY